MVSQVCETSNSGAWVLRLMKRGCHSVVMMTR